MGSEPRVAKLARDLASWQWPDGGWNCDESASGHRSSFHETLLPAKGLFDYWERTGERWAREGTCDHPRLPTIATVVR